MKLLGQRGQAVMEYVLLIGLIGVFSIFAIRNFGQQIEQKLQSSIKRINKTLRVR